MFRLAASGFFLIACVLTASAQEPTPQPSPATAASKPVKVEFEYKMLATNRTSTMEKEMKEAAAAEVPVHRSYQWRDVFRRIGGPRRHDPPERGKS